MNDCLHCLAVSHCGAMKIKWNVCRHAFIKECTPREIDAHDALEVIEKQWLSVHGLDDPIRLTNDSPPIPRPSSPDGMDPNENVREIPSPSGPCCDGLYVVRNLHYGEKGDELFSDDDFIISIAFSMFTAIMKQLRALHLNGFTHGDIKLENITSTNGSWTLIDFGSSHFEGLKDKPSIEGTPAYYSPATIRRVMQGVFGQSKEEAKSEDLYCVGMATLALIAPTILCTILNFPTDRDCSLPLHVRSHPLSDVATDSTQKSSDLGNAVMSFIINTATDVTRQSVHEVEAGIYPHLDLAECGEEVVTDAKKQARALIGDSRRLLAMKDNYLLMMKEPEQTRLHRGGRFVDGCFFNLLTECLGRGISAQQASDCADWISSLA